MGKTNNKQTLRVLMEFTDQDNPGENTKTEHVITSDRGTIGLVQAVAIMPGIQKMNEGFQTLAKMKTLSENPEFADFLADIEKL